MSCYQHHHHSRKVWCILMCMRVIIYHADTRQYPQDENPIFTREIRWIEKSCCCWWNKIEHVKDVKFDLRQSCHTLDLSHVTLEETRNKARHGLAWAEGIIDSLESIELPFTSSSPFRSYWERQSSVPTRLYWWDEHTHRSEREGRRWGESGEFLQAKLLFFRERLYTVSEVSESDTHRKNVFFYRFSTVYTVYHLLLRAVKIDNEARVWVWWVISPING